MIAWLFMVAGAVGIVYHSSELRTQGLFDGETGVVLLVRLLAIVGGIFTLRGANWGRWLLVLWIAYHVVLSLFHTPAELIMHSVLCIATAFVLFRRPANAWFRRIG